MKLCYADKTTRAIADLFEGDAMGFNAPSYVISRINVPKKHRGQGRATALLKQIMADADREGVTLYLEVTPSGGLDLDQLTRWYQRHGFRHMQTGSNVMWRPPQ
jgi:ribosomal protein S18 acetylase RimI-like enzyme